MSKGKKKLSKSRRYGRVKDPGATLSQTRRKPEAHWTYLIHRAKGRNGKNLEVQKLLKGNKKRVFTLMAVFVIATLVLNSVGPFVGSAFAQGPPPWANNQTEEPTTGPPEWSNAGGQGRGVANGLPDPTVPADPTVPTVPADPTVPTVPEDPTFPPGPPDPPTGACQPDPVAKGCTLYHKVTPGKGCDIKWFPPNSNTQGWELGGCDEGTVCTLVVTEECGEWGECVDGIQTQTCTKTFSYEGGPGCPDGWVEEKINTRPCQLPPEEGEEPEVITCGPRLWYSIFGCNIPTPLSISLWFNFQEEVGIEPTGEKFYDSRWFGERLPIDPAIGEVYQVWGWTPQEWIYMGTVGPYWTCEEFEESYEFACKEDTTDLAYTAKGLEDDPPASDPPASDPPDPTQDKGGSLVDSTVLKSYPFTITGSALPLLLEEVPDLPNWWPLAAIGLMLGFLFLGSLGGATIVLVPVGIGAGIYVVARKK